MKPLRLLLPAAVLIVAGCGAPPPNANQGTLPPPPPVDTVMTTGTTGRVTALPPPPVAPQPPSSSEIFEAIKQQFSELSPGTIAFNVPKEMRVAVTSPVTLRLAPKGESVGEVTPSTTTSTVEHVTPTMEVHLDGGDGMDVRSLTQDEQLVAGGGFAEWRWNVTPKRSGKQQLTAAVIARIRIDGRDERRTVRTITQDVTVHVNPTDFIKNHVEWLWGALIVPLAGWLWALYQRRRKRQ